MAYLQLDYSNWEREETYGMFDYLDHQDIKQYPPITIKIPGRLFRSVTSYQLLFSDDSTGKEPNGFEPFLRIEIKKGRFFVVSDEK